MGGMIPPAVLEQIRAASDIVDVIGAYIPLKHAGANFTGLCPFHKEKTPSFNVSPHKQFFYCFGCGVGGSVFTFVQKYENIGFVDAVRRLAERAHIVIEFENDPAHQQARHLKDQLLQIHEQITQRWQSALANDPAAKIARDYLAKRRVSDEAIKLFRIGYAPDMWDDAIVWSRGKGYAVELMEQAGLVIKSEKEDGAAHYYDRFRGRLMFPICDEQGRVVGFSGRVLSGDEKTAKYVNSPESPIFTKGKIMFGLDKSKRAILDARSAIVCEGQLDLISCFMAGVKNIVAPQGTALTSDHARILKRYVEEVVLCFDSDNAGQKAAVRALDSLLAVGVAVRVAALPAPHDPDSFIKQFGGPAYQSLINEAKGFFDYYLERLCTVNDISTEKGRRAVVRDMSLALSKTNDQVTIDTYAQKTALRLNVTTDAVRAEFKKAIQFQEPDYEENEVEDDADAEYDEPETPPPPEELWLVRALLENDDHVPWIHDHLKMEWVNHPAVRFIVASRLGGEADKTWPGLAAWLSVIEDTAARNLAAAALSDRNTNAMNEAILKGERGKIGLVQRLRDKFIERQRAALQQRMARPDLSPEEQRQTLEQFQSLLSLRRQPLEPPQ
jgi:DNA primase